jgi:hypothetical protein
VRDKLWKDQLDRQNAIIRDFSKFLDKEGSRKSAEDEKQLEANYAAYQKMSPEEKKRVEEEDAQAMGQFVSVWIVIKLMNVNEFVYLFTS